MSTLQQEMDFRKKVEKYRKFYEPVDHNGNHEDESKWTYMKCDHSKQHFVVHNVKGYLFQKVVNFIMNLRTTSHAFYLTRHGQSEYNDLGRIGGDSGLTVHGLRYAQKLAEFVDKNIVKGKDGNDVPARLWTSTMRRTRETAQFIKQTTIRIPSETDPSLEYEWVQMRPRAWHHLDELFAGSCDGMTYEEIEEKFPEEWERRNVDKLAYRYPRGESYLDVIARLEPIIIEMERHQEPLLIIGHQAVLRIIYAFYTGHSRSEAPHLSIPLNTVIQVAPGPVECKVTVSNLRPVLCEMSLGHCFLMSSVYRERSCIPLSKVSVPMVKMNPANYRFVSLPMILLHIKSVPLGLAQLLSFACWCSLFTDR